MRFEKLRDGLLNPELFSTLLEAKVLVERWRRTYYAVRSHSDLGYRPLAPEARHTDPQRDRAVGSTQADH